MLQAALFPPHVVQFMDKLGSFHNPSEQWVILEPLPTKVPIALGEEYLAELAEIMDAVRSHGLDIGMVMFQPDNNVAIVPVYKK